MGWCEVVIAMGWCRVVIVVGWMEVAIDVRQQELLDRLVCRENGRCDERISGCG